MIYGGYLKPIKQARSATCVEPLEGGIDVDAIFAADAVA
jgi:hypothetical protein